MSEAAVLILTLVILGVGIYLIMRIYQVRNEIHSDMGVVFDGVPVYLVPLTSTDRIENLATIAEYVLREANEEYDHLGLYRLKELVEKHYECITMSYTRSTRLGYVYDESIDEVEEVAKVILDRKKSIVV